MFRPLTLLFVMLCFPALAIAQPTDAGGLADETYRGIATGDWFLAAGGALSLVVLGTRWLLAKRWPTMGSDLWGVAITAALAGFGALGHAWLADADPLGATTLLGAVKVWAAAVFAYVTTKKLVASATIATPKITGAALVIALSAGCPGPGPLPVVADAVIDCTGENRPQINALFAELYPLVFLQSPDWSAVYQRAKTAGRDIGGCVIAELVQRYLAPAPGKTAPSGDASWAAHQTLEEFRANEAGGASFKTEHGNL